MEAIRKICSKCILIKDGRIELFDETNKVIKHYLQRNEKTELISLRDRRDREGLGGVKLTDIHITNLANEKTIKSGDGLRIVLKYESEFTEMIPNVRIVIIIQNDDLRRILWLDNEVSADTVTTVTPNGTLACETQSLNLIEGRYLVDVNFHVNGISRDLVTMAGDFDVVTDLNQFGYRKKADNKVCDYIVPFTFKQTN